ncbi:neuronal acetylcholine receptor subunit beta-3 isoform X1 [Cygnus olor]|uniref:neuronal acetylcholine receptor subunit beta-3 isoform X1 n=1 Tax=Cygnus olor TaxID=8869 RepID=UPI001ADE54BB|nr:neuronal acetylcholine receptor subunit beta-3 isoform X1 [Cygnus olor]
MWIYKATISVNLGEDHDKQVPSDAGRNRACGPSHLHRRQNFVISDKVSYFSVVSSGEPPSLPDQTQQSKAWQQLQKQAQQATIIQAAWRGYRVRRELDEMNKAAVKIQAAYRGYRTRQELPLGFYDCFGDKKPVLDQTKKEEERMVSLPGVSGALECYTFLGEGSQASGISTGHERPTTPCRDRHDPGTVVIPRAAVRKPTFSLMPSNVLLLGNSLPTCEVFPALTSEQQIHDAADNIWAARRGPQSSEELDKMEREAEKIAERGQILVYSYQLRTNRCEKYQISEIRSITETQKLSPKPQDTVPCPERGLTVRLEVRKENKATNAGGEAPSLRNVDVYAVVRSPPASWRSSMSLRVSSPTGVVEGSHRDAGRGRLCGLYAVRRHGASQPSHVHIHVNVVGPGREAGGSWPRQESAEETRD